MTSEPSVSVDPRERLHLEGRHERHVQQHDVDRHGPPGPAVGEHRRPGEHGQRGDGEEDERDPGEATAAQAQLDTDIAYLQSMKPDTDRYFGAGREPFFLAKCEKHKVTPEQVGITTLPYNERGQSHSGLGGWNMYVNAAS